MKLNLQKTRLTMLAILGILIYVYMIFSSFVGGWDDFKLGLEEGSSLKMKTYFMKLKAVDAVPLFPDSIRNEVSGEIVDFRLEKIAINTDIPKEDFFPVMKYQMLFAVLMNLLVLCNIVIPVLFFMLLRSLGKEMIFTTKNIRYIRIIGTTLIAWFSVDWASSKVMYKINSSLLEFKNYEIASYEPLFYLLLLGVVTLIIAEVISRGATLKEEQDLTI